MNNLIYAELARVKKDIITYILLGAAVAAGVIFGCSSRDSFDDMFIVPLFVILAVFVSLSVGREYNDGTMRNKLIVGRTRRQIFISRLLVNMAVCIIMVLAFLIPCALILAFDVLPLIPNRVLILIVIGFFMLNISWVVMFTVVSFLISAKGVGGIVNIVLIILIMFASYQLEFKLGQPEYIDYEEYNTTVMNDDEIELLKKGEFPYDCTIDVTNGKASYYKTTVIKAEDYSNPSYVRGPLNTLLTVICRMLPHGQINEYVAELTEYLYVGLQDEVPEENGDIRSFPLYSLLLIIIVSAAGTAAFSKKEIR